MDPNATLRDIIEDARLHDWYGASIRCMYLIEWIARGGFLPKRFAHLDRAKVVDVLSTWRMAFEDNI
jgi:hypothetical protein